MGLLKEFKEFAMRGNVIDLAVGIIIGGAFGKIVSSMVNDVMMPPIGLLLGKMDFSKMSIVLQKETLDEAGKVVAPLVAIKYGAFLNMLIDFIFVAIAVFALIKAINTLKRKQEAAPVAPPAPPKQELLLEEIRDILKRK